MPLQHGHAQEIHRRQHQQHPAAGSLTDAACDKASNESGNVEDGDQHSQPAEAGGVGRQIPKLQIPCPDLLYRAQQQARNPLPPAGEVRRELQPEIVRVRQNIERPTERETRKGNRGEPEMNKAQPLPVEIKREQQNTKQTQSGIRMAENPRSQKRLAHQHRSIEAPLPKMNVSRQCRQAEGARHHVRTAIRGREDKRIVNGQEKSGQQRDHSVSGQRSGQDPARAQRQKPECNRNHPRRKEA